jgi:hypothetical protein
VGLIVYTDLGCDVCGAVFMASHGRVPNDGGITKTTGSADEARAAAKAQGWTRPPVKYRAQGLPRAGDVCPECAAKHPERPILQQWPAPGIGFKRRSNP